jgi:hypothetical protein
VVANQLECQPLAIPGFLIIDGAVTKTKYCSRMHHAPPDVIRLIANRDLFSLRVLHHQEPVDESLLLSDSNLLGSEAFPEHRESDAEDEPTGCPAKAN